jgi:hypothetical protein
MQADRQSDRQTDEWTDGHRWHRESSFRVRLLPCLCQRPVILFCSSGLLANQNVPSNLLLLDIYDFSWESQKISGRLSNILKLDNLKVPRHPSFLLKIKILDIDYKHSTSLSLSLSLPLPLPLPLSLFLTLSHRERKRERELHACAILSLWYAQAERAGMHWAFIYTSRMCRHALSVPHSVCQSACVITLLYILYVKELVFWTKKQNLIEVGKKTFFLRR